MSADGGYLADCDPLFREIFGTGHEYDYVYAEPEKEQAAPPSESDTAHVLVNATEALYYVRRRAPSFLSDGLCEAAVSALSEGYTPEYVSFHISPLTVQALYYIQDLLAEYRPGGTPPSQPRQAVHPQPMDGLLAISAYSANLTAQERIHEPRGTIETSTDDPLALRSTFKTVITEIASDPVFRACVCAAREASMIAESPSYSGYKTAYDRKGTYTMALLTRLYTTDEDSPSNDIRRFIVEEAQALVPIGVSDIEKRLFASGYFTRPRNHRGDADALPENCRFDDIFCSLASLTNAIVSLRGTPGTYAGIFHDRGCATVVLLDENGHCTGRSAFRDGDLNGIRAFIARSSTVCITARSPSVRFLVQNLAIPVFYVPYSLTFFAGRREGSAAPSNAGSLDAVAYDIAAVVQDPLIYFARLTKNNLKDHSTALLITRSVRIAASAVKVDLGKILNHRFGRTLLNVLIDHPITIPSSILALDALQGAVDPITYFNLCTFLIHGKSSEPLDRTPLHPCDYSMAVVLCKGALLSSEAGDGTIGDRDAVERILSRPSLLRGLAIPGGAEGVALCRIKAVLLSAAPVVFSGASDEQIFSDIIPSVKGAVSAVITKVGRDFYLAETNEPSDGPPALLYIRKTGEFQLNQAVQARIIEAVPHMLSYAAEIVPTQTTHDTPFIRHRLFRNTDQAGIERLMAEGGHSVLIRSSSHGGFCVVVVRLAPSIFHGFRVHACLDSCTSLAYEHAGVAYSSLDEFIDRFVRGFLRTVRAVASHRAFFRSEADAHAHVSDTGAYRRYAVVFSTANPGFLEFLFGNKHVPLRIDAECLVYRDRSFSTLDDFISYAKGTFT